MDQPSQPGQKVYKLLPPASVASWTSVREIEKKSAWIEDFNLGNVLGQSRCGRTRRTSAVGTNKKNGSINSVLKNTKKEAADRFLSGGSLFRTKICVELCDASRFKGLWALVGGIESAKLRLSLKGFKMIELLFYLRWYQQSLLRSDFNFSYFKISTFSTTNNRTSDNSNFSPEK